MSFRQLKSKYKNELKTLREMGFDNEDHCIDALVKNNNNIELAINHSKIS